MRWVNRTQTGDGKQDVKESVQNELINQKIAARNTQRIRDELADGFEKLEQGKLKEFVTSSLMDHKLEQENMK